MKKNTKPAAADTKPEPKADAPKPTDQPTLTSEQVTSAAPVPTPDLIAKLRAASSLDDAVKVLTPDAKPKAKTDAQFRVVEDCTQPLPKQRGLAVLVYAACVRMDSPFKLTDVEAALPDKKSVRYWVRTLAKSGHLAEV